MVTKAMVIKSEQHFQKKKKLEQIVSYSKAIARTIARSKTARFNFEHIVDSTLANQGYKRPGKPIVPIVVERRSLHMEEDSY